MTAAAVAAALARALQVPLEQPNPAAHAVWWVGGLMLAVLLLVGLVELWDALRGGLRGERRPPGAAAGGGLAGRGSASALRRRHHRRIVPRPRT